METKRIKLYDVAKIWSLSKFSGCCAIGFVEGERSDTNLQDTLPCGQPSSYKNHPEYLQKAKVVGKVHGYLLLVGKVTFLLLEGFGSPDLDSSDSQSRSFDNDLVALVSNLWTKFFHRVKICHPVAREEFLK
ncbi:uncharacterized protein HKW66_Vig0000170 [Vigna angularis]|uniref:Uncharacterized protein n=1 Tax=Phaseolus angularis TaxID=3914 RepID=A0A8T0LCP8_PHAAN|nr:uncharacterized protein HKW66_Vig0000170 [Vigna angularis]